MVDRSADRPVYQQIADLLRAQMVSGELGPGDQLPSEQKLRVQHQANRITIRRALDVLRSEGRVVSRKGYGWYVQQRPMLRRVTSELTGPGELRGWNAVAAAAGLNPEVTATVGNRPAPAHIASWLGIAPETEVLVRDRVMGMEGEPPTQLAASYIPLEVVDRAPALGNVRTGPGGMLTRLEEAGYGPLRFLEVLRARSPLPEEIAKLQLPPGIPVLLVYRITYSADGEVLDAQERIIASDRLEQAYEFPEHRD